MFDGHKFVKIQDNWVFDLTDGIGYSVELDEKGQAIGYSKHWKIFPDTMTAEGTSQVPKDILDKSLEIFEKYRGNY